MAVPKTTPEQWIGAALEALARGGVASVRVERLAASLGVTKGGFYWCFKDRAEFDRRILDAWEQQAVGDVIETLSRVDGAAERMALLFRIAVARIEEGHRGLELAIREWAAGDATVHARLVRADRRRMAYMKKQFLDMGLAEREAEARTFLAFSMFVAGVHDPDRSWGPDLDDPMGAAIEHLLSAAT